MEDSEAILEHVQKHWEGLREKSHIYRFLLSEITLVSAINGTIEAHLDVKDIHVNSKGGLHGTVSACLTDWAGGLAIASTGLDKTGVSTDIHTTYMATAKAGDKLEIVGRASKVGGTLAFTTVSISKINPDGSLKPVANGTHTKYVAQR